jgi:hypothetical protein
MSLFLPQTTRRAQSQQEIREKGTGNQGSGNQGSGNRVQGSGIFRKFGDGRIGRISY